MGRNHRRTCRADPQGSAGLTLNANAALTLTIREAAEELGAPMAVVARVADDLGLLINFGNRKKIDPNDLTEIMNACRSKPKAPASTSAKIPASGSSATLGEATAQQALVTAAKPKTALALYITERDRPRGPASADQMSVSEALNIYLEQHAPTVADPARIAYAAVPLIGFWGDLPVSAIKRETCGAYGRKWVKVVRRDRETGKPVETAPVSVGTIRKDLGVLASTLSFCEAEGRLLNAPKVALPKKPPAKDRWLTRDEAARLVRAAWRNPTSKHLAKFILVALYAGTRKTAILRLRFVPHLSGGHVDIERGKLYRRGATQAETKKRQPPITITPRLLAHLRRWEHLGKGRWVVDYRGNGVSSIKTAWNTAVKDAGLDGTGVNPHTLRHTAITWTMQAGGDIYIYEAAGYFGVSIETMFDVYAHHHPDHQRDAVAAVGRGGRKL